MNNMAAAVVSVVVGGALAAVAVFVGVDQLSLNAKQPDSPLIVYGDSNP